MSMTFQAFKEAEAYPGPFDGDGIWRMSTADEDFSLVVKMMVSWVSGFMW